MRRADGEGGEALREWWSRIRRRNETVTEVDEEPSEEADDETVGDSGGGMLSPSGDGSVGTRANDRLGRTPFAETVAAQIASVDPGEAVVFGVVGPWGSGKTSLVEMAAESLREDHGTVVLWFNPWLFSGTQHLVGIFFAELGAQLGDIGGQPWQELGSAMREFGVALATLRSVPVAGRWLEAGAKGVQQAGSRLEGPADEEASLLERRRRLEEALGKIGEIGKKIVIVVDDLDRLRWQEIRDVVALVRLNADLPNLSFVLAYDRGRVEQALGEAEGDGRAYLEKIVQVAHDVPLARIVDLKSTLVDAVAEVADNASEFGPYDPGRVSEVLDEIVFPLVGSLRGVKRYANALPVTLRTVGDEVALADVLALEAVRLFLPEVYLRLSANAGALTTPADVYVVPDHKDRDEGMVRDFLDAAGDERDLVETVCFLLFPAGDGLVRNKYYDARQDDEAGMQRRVANWRFLRFFLDKRLHQNVVPARKVQEVFKAFGQPEQLRDLLEQEDLEGLDKLMLRLQEYEDAFEPQAVMEAIPVISYRHARLMAEAGRGVDLGSDVTYGGLMSRMLDKWQDPAQLAYQLKVVLPRIDSLSARLELASIVGHRPNTGEKLVSEEDADWLEGYLVTALENASKDSLAQEYDLTHLLIRARQHDEERGERLIARLAEEDGIFLAALLRYCNRSTTGLKDGYMQERQPTLGWEDLCSLFGENTARRRVDELRRKFQPPDLGDPEAEALQLAHLYATGRPPTWEEKR